MLELFKDGDHMAIATDDRNEDEFIREVAAALDKLIEGGKFSGNWAFQLLFWIPQIVDICCAYRGYKNDVRCAYRGYKNDVRIRKQFIAGEYFPSGEHSVITVGKQDQGSQPNGK